MKAGHATSTGPHMAGCLLVGCNWSFALRRNPATATLASVLYNRHGQDTVACTLIAESNGGTAQPRARDRMGKELHAGRCSCPMRRVEHSTGSLSRSPCKPNDITHAPIATPSSCPAKSKSSSSWSRSFRRRCRWSSVGRHVWLFASEYWG